MRVFIAACIAAAVIAVMLRNYVIADRFHEFRLRRGEETYGRDVLDAIENDVASGGVPVVFLIKRAVAGVIAGLKALPHDGLT